MEERNCPMEDPFAFLTLDFLKKSEIFPGSLGTFRYRFQRTGKVNDGTIQMADGSHSALFEIDQDGGKAVVTAKDQPIEVSLVKTGRDGEQLSGAEFAVYRVDRAGDDAADATTPVATVTSSDSSAVKIGGLVGGATYRLVETKAPDGYELLPELGFAVDAHGRVTTDGTPGYSVSEQGGVFTITVSDEPIELTLCKRNLGSAPLSGAKFTLTGRFVDEETHVVEAADHTLMVKMGGSEVLLAEIPDEDGKTYGLAAGASYVLEEIAQPEGYDKIEGTLTFSVDAEGKVSSAAGALAADGAPGYAVSESGVAIVAHDAPYEINIKKRAQDGTPLEGAEFTVTPAEGSSFAGGAKAPIADKTDENGTITLSGVLMTGGSYEVRETKAPSGYRLLDETFTFTMGGDGTISGVATSEGDDAWMTPGYFVSSDGLTLAAVDERRPSVPSDPSGPDDPVDPDEPVDPDDPTDPDEPVDPDEPTDPDDPDAPDDPDVPDTPDDPDTPDTPEDPNDPDVPDTPDTPDTPGDSGAPDVSDVPGTSAAPAKPQTPDTGDHTDFALPVVLMVVGVLLVGGALLVKRRMRK